MSRLTRDQAVARLLDGIQADLQACSAIRDLLERQFQAALRHRAAGEGADLNQRVVADGVVCRAIVRAFQREVGGYRLRNAMQWTGGLVAVGCWGWAVECRRTIIVALLPAAAHNGADRIPVVLHLEVCQSDM